MYKKILATITSTLMVISMAVAPATTAFASEPEAMETELVVTDSSSNKIQVIESITVEDGQTAIYAQGDGVSVTVENDVDAKGATGSAGSYTGATGVAAIDNAEVNVGGSVSASGIGISAFTGASVNVEKNVTGSGADSSIRNLETNTVEDTVMGRGIYTDGNANIYVGGKVTGETDGIAIDMDNNNQKGNIVVIDTISQSRDTASLSIYHSDSHLQQYGINGFDYDSVDDALDDIPSVTIYESKNGVNVSVYVKDDSGNGQWSREVYTDVLNAINYIIKQDDASNEQYGISVSGSNVKYDDTIGYNTVNLGKAFQVAASNLPSTHTIYGGKNVYVHENENGTYTLYLTNSEGGINISAVLRPVSVTTTNEDGQKEETVQYVAEVKEVTPAAAVNTTTQAADGAIVVANAATPAAITPEVAAISGDKPAKTVSIDLGKVSPVQYRATVVQNVATTPAGGAFNIQTDRVSFLDKNMIAAFAARPDIDVNVVFTYNGKKMKVVIPAGYDVKTLLDSNGYCGFLRLMALLGGTELS